MRKKFLCSTMLVAFALHLVACGDGSDETATSQQGQIVDFMSESSTTDENVASESQSGKDLEELTAEDYWALAEQYREQGLIRKQRDVLEKSYRLYGDSTAFETLQTINVNLEEEDASVQEQANLMLQNLELQEYLSESINLISTEEWFKTMMPKLYEGNRNYFLQKDGQTALYIQAGYTQSGEPFTKVWYLGEQAKVLRKEGDAVQLLVTQIEDGNYQGAFESWTLDGSTGDIYHETGTFGNSVLTGDYMIAIHEGTESSDLFSMWSNKEGMKYTTYNGHFNEQGISTLEQPTAKKIASLIADTEYNSCIVYAIDVNDCLFEGLAEGEEPATYVFGIEKMGWEMYPSFTVYEPVEDAQVKNDGTTDAEQINIDLQVRVFDGELQIYQNGTWVGMGSVEEYIQADPFQIYENNRPIIGEVANDSVENGRSVLGYKRSGGTIPKDKVVTKPATQKPAQQEQPQQTPQQTTPTPAPTPTPTPIPTPTPTPTPEPTPPADSGNNDVDVEWTPDIL